MIRFRCSQCGKKLKAEEDIIGRSVRCSRCQSVEKVPSADNLAKPFSPRVPSPSDSNDSGSGALDNLQVVKPNRPSKREKPKLEEPAEELFGHSAIRPDSRLLDDPESPKQFNVVKRKEPLINWDRWLIPIGATLAGLGLIAVITCFVISAQYAPLKLAEDFEKLEEVQYYYRSAVELEKSRVKMSIMSQAFQSTKFSASEVTGQFAMLEKKANGYKRNSEDLLKEAGALFAEGRDVHAKSKLVLTGRDMRALKDEIDAEVNEFNQKIHQR